MNFSITSLLLVPILAGGLAKARAGTSKLLRAGLSKPVMAYHTVFIK